MLKRLLISHRIPALFFKTVTAGLLSAFVCAWIFTACGRINQVRQLSTDLRTAIERVADQAIPAVVHIVVKEHQEMANPFLAYEDNPFSRRFFGLPKDMPKKLERELVGIGINSVIASQSGGFEGIGFAIPSNMADHVAKALIDHGKVERGWVGVSSQDLTADLAKSFGLKVPKGALIAEVQKGSPGDSAGLKKGDTVIAYQSRDITGASAFRNSVANSPIGQPVKVGVWRDGRKQEIRVTVGNLDDARKAVVAELRRRLGVAVRALAGKEAENYELSLLQGVAIQWIDSKGPMGAAGFEVGDVILALDDHPVQGVDSFNEMMTVMPHHQKVVLLAVSHKNGQSGYVQVEIL